MHQQAECKSLLIGIGTRAQILPQCQIVIIWTMVFEEVTSPSSKIWTLVLALELELVLMLASGCNIRASVVNKSNRNNQSVAL